MPGILYASNDLRGELEMRADLRRIRLRRRVERRTMAAGGEFLRSKTWTALALVLPAICPAALLRETAKQGFQRYTLEVEARLRTQHAAPQTFLATLNRSCGERSGILQDLRSGGMRVEPVNGGTREIAGGLIHHWRGAAFVPGVSREEMLALLKDADHLATYYAPEVEWSRTLANRDGTATVAMRLRKQQIMTVVLDGEYAIEAKTLGDNGGYEVSRSVHIWQVDWPGTRREHRRPEGEDFGFLWCLNAYWSFLQVPGGLLIECEAVSLTRDVPMGLSRLIRPMLDELPRTSLEFTLTATKRALLARAGGREGR